MKEVEISIPFVSLLEWSDKYESVFDMFLDHAKDKLEPEFVAENAFMQIQTYELKGTKDDNIIIALEIIDNEGS